MSNADFCGAASISTAAFGSSTGFMASNSFFRFRSSFLISSLCIALTAIISFTIVAVSAFTGSSFFGSSETTVCTSRSTFLFTSSTALASTLHALFSVTITAFSSRCRSTCCIASDSFTCDRSIFSSATIRFVTLTFPSITDTRVSLVCFASTTNMVPRTPATAVGVFTRKLSPFTSFFGFARTVPTARSSVFFSMPVPASR